MAERREIRLDDDDTIAAAQILSWIARPLRVGSAMKVLDHWRRELQRSWGKGDPVAEAGLMRRNRIEGQFRRLEGQCLDGMRAGLWLNHELLRACPHPWFEAFQNSAWRLAERSVEEKATGSQANNEYTRVWAGRRPVTHLALGAANAIGGQMARREMRGFSLSWSILNPAWVNDALEQSEQWQRSAARTMDADLFHRFYRDSFLE